MNFHPRIFHHGGSDNVDKTPGSEKFSQGLDCLKNWGKSVLHCGCHFLGGMRYLAHTLLHYHTKVFIAMDQLTLWISSLYETLGLEVSAHAGDIWGLISLILILLGSGAAALKGGEETPQIEEAPAPTKEEEKEKEEDKTEPVPVEEPAPAVEPEPKPAPVPKRPWRERLQEGLSRSNKEVWGRVTGLFGSRKLDDELIEEIEELLYGADLGPQTVQAILEELETKVGQENFSEADFKSWLFKHLKDQLEPVQAKLDPSLFEHDPSQKGKTKVIMVVGVNGAGKTTTIGKLATKWTQQGANVVVGACDTFRAAAVDQLQVWCERAGAKMIRAKEGANPSGVGYEALQTALNEKADYCLLDTAGRLHTKSNLMEELTKSKNVLSKLDPEAPHQILLVIDAITGQNAIRQAQEFHQALGLSGLIFTKCDGSSKAGSAISIVNQLGVPMSYIGVGESVEDLNIFNTDDYLNALLDMENTS